MDMIGIQVECDWAVGMCGDSTSSQARTEFLRIRAFCLLLHHALGEGLGSVSVHQFRSQSTRLFAQGAVHYTAQYPGRGQSVQCQAMGISI